MDTYEKGKRELSFLGSLCKDMICKPRPKGKITPLRGVLLKRAFLFHLANIVLHLCLYSYLDGPLFLQYGQDDDVQVENFYEMNGVDSRFFLYVVLSMRILIALPFFFWP